MLVSVVLEGERNDGTVANSMIGKIIHLAESVSDKEIIAAADEAVHDCRNKFNEKYPAFVPCRALSVSFAKL